MQMSVMLIRVRAAWLTTCAAMLMICADAAAQARGPAVRSPAASSRENVDRIETAGNVAGTPVGLRCDGQHCFMDRERTGIGTCEAFAHGPGMLCAIRVPWPLFHWSSANFSARGISAFAF